MFRKALSWGLVFVYMAFIFYSSSQPGTGRPLPFPHADKLWHMGIYALLGVLVLNALVAGANRELRSGFCYIAVLVGSLYGVSDEIHQYFVPGRHADILDVLADIAGSCLGVFLADKVFTRILRPR